MQFTAAYDQAEDGALPGGPDPWASTKEILIQSQPTTERDVRAGDSGQHGEPGAAFDLSGQVVWQLLRGDWFDAAMIYRDCAAGSHWYPKLGPDGPRTPR